MKLSLFFLSLIFSFTANLASAQIRRGDEKLNGGDTCELRFQNVRNDIALWINNGGGAGLQFMPGLDENQYNVLMREQISKAIISCVSEPVTVGATEKTCKNFFDPQGHPRIICNAKRFTETDESNQYVLVHHEYAGLAGLETNLDEASNYPLSRQLTAYLEMQEIQKLVLKPGLPSNCNLISKNPEAELVTAIRQNNLSCIAKLAPTMDLNHPFDVGNAIPGTNWGNRQSPLAYAACLGRTDAIQILVKKGAFIHYSGIYGMTAVNTAAFVGQPEAIRVLVKNGAFLNTNTCNYGNTFRPCDTPLSSALLYGNPTNRSMETVETLLQLGADPSMLSNGWTPLAAAAFIENFTYVDLLRKYGAYINQPDHIGATPIFYCNTAACVDKLASFNDLLINQKDYRGRTALDFAMTTEAKNALKKHGALPGTP